MDTLFGARTHFSLGQSIVPPKTLVKIVKEAGYGKVAVADVHSVNGLVDAHKIGEEIGVEVIIGATVRVVDDIAWRKAGRGEPKKKPNPFFMPSLYVKNDEGLKDLFGLLSLAQDEDHFYFVPQIDLEELVEVLEKDNLVMTTGNAFSLFSHSSYTNILDTLKTRCPYAEIRSEIVVYNNPYYDRINELAINASDDFDLGVIYSRPVWHLEGDSDLRNTLNCILDRNTVDQIWRNEPGEDLHILTPDQFDYELEQVFKRLSRYGVIEHTKKIEESPIDDLCEYRWHDMEMSLPKMADNSFNELVRLSKEGWAKRINNPVLGYKPSSEKMGEYKKRLIYELGVIKKLGFEDYFLIVQDVMKWCADQKIATGAGRGSAAGSLLSFLIGITDVDPIRFGLIFERFLNPDRNDWPDIDLDFMSSRREEVIRYLIDKYGEDRVAGISNYGMLGGKSALRQVASAHNLSEIEYRCSKQLGDAPLEESLEIADIRKFAENHSKVWREAVGLQKVYRSAGKHAAGVVVAGEPIANRAVVERRKEGFVTNWDKKSIEDWGLIKLDILGLSTLDLLAKAADYVEKRTGNKIDYTKLPLDDKPTLEAFSRGDTLGIFQFDGGNARHMLKEAGSEGTLTFDEVSAVTALNRPGPLETGIAETWMQVRKGFAPLEYLVPDLEPVLVETYGQMVYQEQIMEIAKVLSGFSMSEADYLRRAIGKKDMELMKSYREKFVDGAKSKIGEAAAEELFTNIEAFAAYCFNKSHSTAYSLISYQSQYMKTHHTAEFYAAALSILGEEKLPLIVKEAESKNIYIVPPDINRSSDQFEIGYDEEAKQTLLFAPFQAIKGLSVKASEAIMQAKRDIGRDFKSKEEFVSVVNRRACNIRGQSSLDLVGAFASIEPDQLPARHPDRVRDQKMLLPGIIAVNVRADRKISVTKETSKRLVDIIADYQQAGEVELGATEHPTPRLGKNAKFMIVSDFPTWSECEAGKYGEGKGASPIKDSLGMAGLSFADCYVTALGKCRKPKDDAEMQSAINCYSGFLTKEIELLKPPIIVTMGTKTFRKLVPDVKGTWEELAGTSHYLAEYDCTVVAGINTGMLFFDPSKQSHIDKAFQIVSTLIV